MECFSSSNTLNLRLSSVGLGPYGYAYLPPAMLDPYNKRPRPPAAASLPSCSNAGFLALIFFFHMKSTLSDNFLYFLAYPIIKLQAKRIQLNWLFKLSYLSSKFVLSNRLLPCNAHGITSVERFLGGNLNNVAQQIFHKSP